MAHHNIRHAPSADLIRPRRRGTPDPTPPGVGVLDATTDSPLSHLAPVCRPTRRAKVGSGRSPCGVQRKQHSDLMATQPSRGHFPPDLTAHRPIK